MVEETGVPLTQGSPKRQKKLALRMFRKAAANPSFRFEFVAAWRDVVAKAKRIRGSGGVRITAVKGSIVIGQVRGDHDVYESGIQRYPGRPQSVFAFSCGCPWASFHQDKSYPGHLNGRMCSHALALLYEAGARTRFGRKPLQPDPAIDVPYAEVVTKSMPPWGPGGWRETWTAPATIIPVTSLKKLAVGPDFQEPDDLRGHLEHEHQYGPEWLNKWSLEDMRKRHNYVHDSPEAQERLEHNHNFFGREYQPHREVEPEESGAPDYYGGHNQNRRRDEPGRTFHRYQDVDEFMGESGPWEKEPEFNRPLHLSHLDAVLALYAEDGERDTCELCHKTIRKSTMDPANPWLHEHSGNAFCDVEDPGDAVGLAGMAGEGFERAEAKPMMFEGAEQDFWSKRMPEIRKRRPYPSERMLAKMHNAGGPHEEGFAHIGDGGFWCPECKRARERHGKDTSDMSPLSWSQLREHASPTQGESCSDCMDELIEPREHTARECDNPGECPHELADLREDAKGMRGEPGAEDYHHDYTREKLRRAELGTEEDESAPPHLSEDEAPEVGGTRTGTPSSPRTTSGPGS